MPKKKTATTAAPYIATDYPGDISAHDLGNSRMKIVAPGVLIEERSVQAIITEASRMDGLPYQDVIGLGDRWYAFGQNAHKLAAGGVSEWAARNRYTDDFYMRFFAYSLHRIYGHRIGEIVTPRVVSSVPAAIFKVRQQVEKIRDNLAGLYEIRQTNGTTLRIEMAAENIRIIPEGAGSFLHALAQNPTLSQGNVMFADVGYLTVNAGFFSDSQYVPDSVQSEDLGMRLLSEAVQRHILAETDVDLTIAEIDEEIHCPSIRVSGQSVDIETAKADALRQLSDRIIQFLRRMTARTNVSSILLTGGGADLIHPYITGQGLPSVVLCPDARNANVLGGYALLT